MQIVHKSFSLRTSIRGDLSENFLCKLIYTSVKMETIIWEWMIKNGDRVKNTTFCIHNKKSPTTNPYNILFRLKKKYVWYTEYTINIIIYIFLYIIVKFTLLPQPTCTLERNFCETKRLMTLCCFPINFYSSQLWDKLLPFFEKKNLIGKNNSLWNNCNMLIISSLSVLQDITWQKEHAVSIQTNQSHSFTPERHS